MWENVKDKLITIRKGNTNFASEFRQHVFDFYVGDTKLKECHINHEWQYTRTSVSEIMEYDMELSCGSKLKVHGFIDIKQFLRDFDSLQRHYSLLKILYDKGCKPNGLIVKYNNLLCILPPSLFEIGIYQPTEKDICTMGHMLLIPVSSILCLTSVRCQGLTLDKVKYKYPTYMEKSPLKQSVYVVLSRVTKPEDIELSGNVLLSLSQQKFMRHAVMNFIKNIVKNKNTFIMY